MGAYIPLTAQDRSIMLEKIGLSSEKELFSDIPSSLFVQDLALEDAMSEMEVRRTLTGIASQNHIFSSIFRGAGAYHHYIPSLVKQISSKETFLTAYTPYQAEISQGILQMIFEYQTEICSLTGMDISNASVYDGASAAAEAAAMCRERKRQRTLIAQNIHPEISQVLCTYLDSAGQSYSFVGVDKGLLDIQSLKQLLADDVASLVVQTPNYFGLIEQLDELVPVCHEAGVKVIVSCNPISLALLRTPAEAGADIAVGEGQPLGLSMAFGGPYLGFLACRKDLMRKIPGRVVGQTTDPDGKRCFVLTLQAREQHIRREKALSSICSNEALCALTATVYLAAMGPDGLTEVARQCYSKAHYAAGKLAEAGFKLRYDSDFFHEFVTECPCDTKELLKRLESEDILGGLPCEGGLLWCVTECNSKQEIDRLVTICREVSACN